MSHLNRMLARNADVDLVSWMIKGDIFMGRMVGAASEGAFRGYIRKGNTNQITHSR